MRLLVIGGVAAGLSAASRARRFDKNLEIVVLEKGSSISYAACGLPYLVEGRVREAAELVVYTPEYFARERNIAVRTGAEAVSLHHSRRQVVLAGGERLHYDKLVIATGARPDRRLLGGRTLPNVFTLHTLEDALRLREFLVNRRPRRAAVVGGGYIGLEAAEALRTHGMRVTLFEASAFLLGRPDSELTQTVARHLERCGIEVRLNQSVRSLEADRVDDTACDLVVLAAGFLPNVELAAEAGAELGPTGALRVSEYLETNLSSVYAAGDCAETVHLVTGRPVWIPLGTTANKMGRVAGANAAGRRERFPGVVGTAIVRAAGLGVAITGLAVHEAKREGFDPAAVRIEARTRARYFRGKRITVELVADRRTARLLGGSVVGEQGVAGRINVVAAALTARMRVDEFQHLDLAYAPPFAPVWDPLLIAAQQLLKQL
ncbi:MAG: FAD-dependent oxidoreductase [Bryobacterales bacterium]|nr:FAD-dependent oxidoreductase [Bryobacteraceae bacterium]MDW8355347.1 FAD-dependent oxidoreductase [Bryobacterales bacterium]